MIQRLISTPILTCGLLIAAAASGAGCIDTEEEDREDDAGAAHGDLRDAGAIDASVSGDAAMQADGAYADGGAPAFGDTYGLTSAARLVRFERATGKIARSVSVAGLGAGETLLGLDVRPADGSFVALSSANKLYTIDPESGVAMLKASLIADPADASEPFTALQGTSFGVDFNPVVDRFRVVSDSGQNLRINVDTGATFTDGALNPGTPRASAAAYTNSFASACRTRLFVIDAAARKLLLQDPPNDGKLTEIGSLGDASTAIRGFDILTRGDGTNLGLVAASAGHGEVVAQIDLATGALSNAQPLALEPGETLQAVVGATPTSAPAQAPGELLAVTASSRVVSFNRAAPGKLCTSNPIAGLASGEHVVGADVRPADGQLYALSSHAKLYTVAPATGAAALKATLTADPADASEPFAGLVGSEFGVGFNPVPDRLRVVSDSGQNLRINVDTGVTTTDVALNPGSPALTAVAYTNSFAGAKSTTLYALDTGADALVLLGGNPASGGACPDDVANPNCGVVSAVGSLQLGDLSGVNGFDIEPSTGLAFAAVQIAGAASSTLYAINLTTGAAALPAGTANGTIGGGEPIRALTFAVAPTLTAYVATGDNRLLAFAPSAPDMLTKELPIVGLQSAETLIGVDFRPADGKLYGVGTSGRLYTIDTGDGQAREVAPLSAAMGSAFSALPAASYGFDFNPAADALRLVNDAAHNFRVLPSARAAGAAGATFMDADLNPDAPRGLAAGYTNNFAASASTTLFVLDAATLYRQGGVNGDPSPNTGTLTAIGALGVAAQGDLGFDIVGGQNGLALAAISPDGGAASLYAINLATGAATPFNAANNALAGTGSCPLRGLALELK